MKRNVKLLLVGLLVLGMIVSVVGCGGQKNSTQSSKKPVLTVGSETTYAPFEFVKDGQCTGFDIELIKAIAAAEGYDVKVSSLGFDALIPALQANKVDCTISAMTIKPDRQQAIDFSTPYFTAGLVVAVAQNNNSIKGTADLSGKKLAGEVGTTGLNAENAIRAKAPTTQVQTFDSVGEAFMQLEKGSADAVINDFPVTAYYIKTTGKDKIKMVGDVFNTTDKYGIGVKKGNTKILKVINDGLAKVKANGQYDKIYKTWFGTEK